MSRDYQKEYNDLYKEYLEYTETVDESIKDQADMNKFYNEYILKYQSKRDYVVDYMNKIVTDAKAEGIKIKERPIKYYKIKRSEIMDDIEDRDGKISKFTTIEQCDKSIDDNQKKIDKLKDEIAQLEYYIKVAEKKKSDLKNKKRSENMDNLEIEERALQTQEDYINKHSSLIKKCNSLQAEADKIYENAQSEIDLIAKEYQSIIKEVNKIQNDYKDKFGESLKYKVGLSGDSHALKLLSRSEVSTALETRKKEIVANLTNLEERKNAILDNLETRAANTSKWDEDDFKEAFKEGEDAIKMYKKQIAKYEKELKDAEPDTYKEANAKAGIRIAETEIKRIEKLLDIYSKDAKKKGFNIKRSFGFDIDEKPWPNTKITSNKW